MRIQKFLSHCGICSRREAEVLIKNKRVKVNGIVIEKPCLVNPDKDIVEVNGKKAIFGNYIYIKYYKPAGIVSSMKDPYGKKNLSTVFDFRFGKIYHIGRLDKNSEGLLLLTNDGDFAHKVIHPSHNLKKFYYIEAKGRCTREQIKKISKGIFIYGKKTLPADIKIISLKKDNIKLDICIKEGKKRQIRKMLKSIGLTVTKLKRYKIGNLKLGSLKPGQYITISKKEAYKIF